MQYPAQRPMIPCLPHNQAQLHIDQKVISSKIKQSIRDAFTVPPYMEYLKKRNRWTSECIATIDWKAYNQAVSRFHSQRIQITKLCNDLLPTARWASCYDSLTSEHCLHCGETEERDHLVQCSFAPHEKWRTELLSHLRATHDNPLTNPYLVDILIDGLHSWLHHSHIDTARYPRRYHQLINEQSAIVWRQIFNGHLSTQWRIRQDRYLRRGKFYTQTRTGANWTLRTLTTVWTAFFQLWKERNAALHGHDLKTQNQARHRRLRAEIELIHTQRDLVLAVDQDVFIGENSEALDTFLSVSTATHVQNWIHIWQPLIVSSVKSAKALAIQGVRVMSDYFLPETSPHTGPRHPNTRAHRTTRPRHKVTRSALPQPSFRFRSLRSFFGLPSPPTSVL